MTNQITIPIAQEFDWRFLARLAIGIGYSTYGDHYLSSPYYQSLKKVYGIDSERNTLDFMVCHFSPQAT